VLDGPPAAGLELGRELLAPLLAGTGEIALAVGRGGLPVLHLRSEAPQPPVLYRVLEEAVAAGRIAGASIAAAGAGAAVLGDPREHVEHPDGAPLLIASQGFAQGNDAMNRLLVERVVALAAPSGARVLELHAGSGNLTVALARDAAELTAVESDAAAAAACRENLAARGLAAKVREARAEDAAGGDRVDVVVLDPPRTGARGALDGIAARRPDRIVYVSCDTATLGRDLGDLARLGYGVDAAVALDMFPHSAEVESIVRLRSLAATDRGR
jgi:23S rRNA (uracil1939-C5)-methyltransferase